MSHLRLVHSAPDTAAGASQPLDEIEVESDVAQQCVQSSDELPGVSAFAVRSWGAGALEIEKSIPPCSEQVRARAVARARAVLAMERAHLPVESPALPILAVSRRPRLYFGASVCLAFGIGVIGTVIHDGRGVQLAAAPALPEMAAETAPRAAAPIATVSTSSASTHGAVARHHGRAAAAAVIPPGSCSNEGECLKRIWKAFADQDYRAALAGVSEHRRRFPRGQLREERDALQVLSLAGAGHTDEARQASAVFGERFPGSILSPRIRRAVGTD